MKFTDEAVVMHKTLAQMRDMEPEDFEVWAPKYLELNLRRAAREAAQSLVAEEREFEHEVRSACSRIEDQLNTLRTACDKL